MKPLRWTTAALAVAGLFSAVLIPPAANALTSPGLDPYHRQPINWHACQQDPADEEGAALDEAGARCAELTVPLDYTHPAGRAVTLSLSMIAATDTANRIGPLIFNLGGPGIPVRGRVIDAAAAMGVTGARFDLIGLDPRFTGRSTPADCQWQSTWITRSTGVDKESFVRTTALSARLATQCATRHPDILPFVTSVNMARDMDIVRAALGAPKLSYLGYSYGTYIGVLYAQLFPDRTDRLVLDSAVDPDDVGVHVRNDGGPAREAALNAWAAWAARHDDKYHLGTSGPEVRALVDRIYRTSAARPLKVGRFLVDDTVIPGLLINPLSDDLEADADQLARFVRTLADAATGTAVPVSPDLDQALAGILTGANSTFASGQTMISCADAAVPRNPLWYYTEIQRRRAQSPLFAGLGLMSPCAFWPINPPTPPTIHNNVPALIVHADGDIGTTPALNQAMHRALPASSLLTLTNTRTHGVYLFRGSPCIDTTVNTYLTTATLPPPTTTCTP